MTPGVELSRLFLQIMRAAIRTGCKQGSLAWKGLLKGALNATSENTVILQHTSGKILVDSHQRSQSFPAGSRRFK